MRHGSVLTPLGVCRSMLTCAACVVINICLQTWAEPRGYANKNKTEQKWTIKSDYEGYYDPYLHLLYGRNPNHIPKPNLSSFLA